MRPNTVILITGHPGAGKTTLARVLGRELAWPALCKDDIKETLYDTLGWSTVEWSNQLSVATWTLLYRQIEMLIAARVNFVVEANFDPKHADAKWQLLKQRYDARLIQIRCESDAATLLGRYRARVESGERHPGHLDGRDNPVFYAAVQQGPLPWVAVECERISVDTGALRVEEYAVVAQQVAVLLGNEGV